MTDAILALNAGSSSLKFSLFDVGPGQALETNARGQIETIPDAPHFIAQDGNGRALIDRRLPSPASSYSALIAEVMDWVEFRIGGNRLIGVGHRVVHGGVRHYRPERVTDELLAALDALTPLAPLHQPHNLAPIRDLARTHPGLAQIACFDTAFHHTMPEVATRFAIPQAYEAEGVRRYGFHGLSYEYIAGRLAELAPDVAQGRVIVAHLGNGASLCALKAGRSVDTTMGFTALDGLVMGTRCGDLDPGVILYLEQQHGMSPKTVETLLYKQSGLLGISGLSGDMRALQVSRDPRARSAIDLFVFRLAREAGGLVASLGGLDGLVFTAGIGEHAPGIRAEVCRLLSWLGVRLDPAANDQNELVITMPDSRIKAYVIPTDEDWMIARHVLGLVAPDHASHAAGA
jgi:acetate kinase